jgi:hypothetical protein
MTCCHSATAPYSGCALPVNAKRASKRFASRAARITSVTFHALSMHFPCTTHIASLAFHARQITDGGGQVRMCAAAHCLALLRVARPPHGSASDSVQHQRQPVTCVLRCWTSAPSNESSSQPTCLAAKRPHSKKHSRAAAVWCTCLVSRMCQFLTDRASILVSDSCFETQASRAAPVTLLLLWYLGALCSTPARDRARAVLPWPYSRLRSRVQCVLECVVPVSQTIPPPPLACRMGVGGTSKPVVGGRSGRSGRAAPSRSASSAKPCTDAATEARGSCPDSSRILICDEHGTVGRAAW